MHRFLVQVSAALGYANIMDHRRYVNGQWTTRPRDRDHGQVAPGDELLVYCTGNVPDYGKSLAFRVAVTAVSPDGTTLELDEPRPFPFPMGLADIRRLVDDGNLPAIFSNCGRQGFNIARLDHPATQQILELVGDKPIVEQEAGNLPDNDIAAPFEQWLVDHWRQVDFGAPLRLYVENGKAVGQQYDTGAVGIIDLLGEDTASGALVVIELHRGRSSDAVVGQLICHMGWVQEHLAGDRPVHGILLTPGSDARLRYAAKAVPGVRLLRYETRFAIFPPDD